MSYEGADNNSAKVVSPARLGYEPGTMQTNENDDLCR
ncbi:hypothetical protein FOPG_03604 [Fusarium oxysporum f. sp. conglutinans race 2 54008]|uniref:Uncharacterized protein n=2 Tax=Fusarium oxysporum TaxID=5507 RepID=X0LC11_FUSOX|nr:hypothetical protein FOPG_03604 [Fusarium oxysporum f. sp. conglutinans race 2 54008]EXM23328.1 hypothetical protein FOTG_09215 [Fusarium oxysporum f. sp. vasinfectum 25433]